jgi:hypothetical protein
MVSPTVSPQFDTFGLQFPIRFDFCAGAPVPILRHRGKNFGFAYGQVDISRTPEAKRVQHMELRNGAVAGLGGFAGKYAQTAAQHLPRERRGLRQRCATAAGVLQVVGRRVDISFQEEWGERAPRTQIVAIGAAGAIDASLLEKEVTSSISAAAARM